jgi:hypothetical protein
MLQKLSHQACSHYSLYCPLSLVEQAFDGGPHYSRQLIGGISF